jgi:chromosome segregation ATPase
VDNNGGLILYNRKARNVKEFLCASDTKKGLKIVEKEKNERSLKGTIDEIKGIERGLSSIIKEIERGLSMMLDDLKEKIERLKNEKAELVEEIEALKKEGETRAGSLEDEIFSLRDEVEELKKMLGESD